MKNQDYKSVFELIKTYKQRGLKNRSLNLLRMFAYHTNCNVCNFEQILKLSFECGLFQNLPNVGEKSFNEIANCFGFAFKFEPSHCKYKLEHYETMLERFSNELP